MASFQTCFTPEWRYAVVFECQSGKDALLLEQAVLYCLSSKRVEHRELLRITDDEASEIATLLADKLRLRVTKRVKPCYRSCLPTAAPRSIPTGSSSPSSAAPLLRDMQTAEEDPLPSGTELTATIRPYRETLDSFKADLNGSFSPCCGETRTSHSEKATVDEEDDEESVNAGDLDFQSSWIDAEDYSFSELRPYQKDAVARLIKELDANQKAVCQMACRCGKTPVAFHIIQRVLRDGRSRRVLYLVPGLSLLRQTARKLFSYGLQTTPLLLIGCDPVPVILDDQRSVTMTTDPSVIRATILGHAALVVISTYHSSPLLQELNIFQLTVFDECHRVCGSAADTAFNSQLRLPLHGQRLFLTATPPYDTPIKMSDTAYFGGIAYRYYLREGINAGVVNPFSVRVVLGGSMEHMNPYFFEAMRLVDKMLVFCRNITHAQQLYESLLAEPPPKDVAAFTVLLAHSRMGSAAVAAALQRFTTAKRCLLLNVRLFQEGVEIPDLNAVFFVAPRYSSRDIIQSICRPLNRVDGKPPSFVFLPAEFDRRYAADHVINLKSFSTLIPFTDALMDEDPALFEYMIDPEKKSYNFDVVGVRALTLTSEKLRSFILPAIRRGVRYSTRDTDRLHRTSRLPWRSVFKEMQRIVCECHRYPKTNDAWVIGQTSISMNMFYQYVRRGYRLYQRGEPTFLQVHQLRDLESLSQWTRYGVYGPYPWKECMQTLERHLRLHKAMPPLDVHKGGYIGLDATPFERLSGCLMNVNQADSRLRVGISPDKQADLDRICAAYHLRWRKRRTASGAIVKNDITMITRSYIHFKRLYEKAATVPAFQRYLDLHYPGYPQKHLRMETLDNLRKGIVPPRRALPLRNVRGRKRQTAKAQRPTATAPNCHAVMCRICRTHVPVPEWQIHLSSEAHQRALSALA